MTRRGGQSSRIESEANDTNQWEYCVCRVINPTIGTALLLLLLLLLLLGRLGIDRFNIFIALPFYYAAHYISFGSSPLAKGT